jgi:hypothetical protein
MTINPAFAKATAGKEKAPQFLRGLYSIEFVVNLFSSVISPAISIVTLRTKPIHRFNM